MPDEFGKLLPHELKERWEKTPGKKFREEIVEQLTSWEKGCQVDWDNLRVIVEEDGFITYIWKDFIGVNELYNLEHNIIDLRGIDFSRKNLSSSNLNRANLKYANLEGTKLDLANLEEANLESVNLEDATLSYANLMYAVLIHANLKNALLFRANLKYAKMNYAHLERTFLNEANLEHVNLYHSFFHLKTFWERIREIIKKHPYDGYKHPTKLDGAIFAGASLEPVLYRELLDEQYLDNFASTHKIFCPFWLITSNCGRRVKPLFAWILFFGIIFGFVFADFSSPEWLPESIRDFLEWYDPKFHYNGSPQTIWWQPFYLSFVTMTTLGVASAEPANDAAFWWHTCQNLFGYVMLGYLVAVLGSKLTRRSA